ncbi:hypothetical protein EST38_g6750 [Candolleomyces aberdarensis]|uniref:Uncharacterized protein n=1 Tax=Candolleomyces aberdarensis TaxID=2316362 RepID=A0A4Q2DH09_9AGAR|nr:hypothetical protein EST38_g6750 [Candolleomyces aberdarensis]
MSYTSPFLNYQPYVSGVNNLSAEGITIDEGVARAVRQAADFSNNYSVNWSLVWTKALQQSRDAASSISGWYQRFNQVFLSMLNDVESEQDAKDLVTEFKALLRVRCFAFLRQHCLMSVFLPASQEVYPSKKYDLESTPGPKKAFEEIEGLVTKESEHIVRVLGDEKDWHKSITELKKNLLDIQKGVEQIRGALNNYATKLA